MFARLNYHTIFNLFRLDVKSVVRYLINVEPFPTDNFL